MFYVQLPGSVRFDSQIKFHTGTKKEDVSLAKGIKYHPEKDHRQNGDIDKWKKSLMEIKRKERKYHVQDNDTVELKYVKIYCDTNQFPELSFSGPHSKPHVARGLSKHYHLRFYPQLGMGVCAIIRIPFACVACTSIIDKPWISGISSDKQERYKTVTKCTYWPVLWSLNNLNIIELSPKSTSSDTFDEIH